jgi:hypothetical protein
LAVPSSSSQDVADDLDVREESAASADRGRAIINVTIRLMRLILVNLNKSILSCLERLIGFG